MANEMDAAIGKLMDEPEAHITRNDTLVFMSDNGALTGHRLLPGFVYRLLRGLEAIFGIPVPDQFLEFLHANMYDGGGGNTPLRGGKTRF